MQEPKPSSASKAFLLAAIALGVLATLLAFAFINSTAGTDRGPEATIVVATHDLRANAPLDPSRDLKAEKIPARFVTLARQSLDAEVLSNYKGQRVNRLILAGQPVLLNDLGAGGDLEIRPGYNALTFPAQAGLVIPGDYVKVIVNNPAAGAAIAATGPARVGGAGSTMPGVPGGGLTGTIPINGYIVGNGRAFRVLAVNGSLARTRSQATNQDQYESSGTAKLITLEVTDDQAREIVSVISLTPERNMLLICPPPPDAPPAH